MFPIFDICTQTVTRMECTKFHNSRRALVAVKNHVMPETEEWALVLTGLVHPALIFLDGESLNALYTFLFTTMLSPSAIRSGASLSPIVFEHLCPHQVWVIWWAAKWTPLQNMQEYFISPLPTLKFVTAKQDKPRNTKTQHSVHKLFTEKLSPLDVNWFLGLKFVLWHVLSMLTLNRNRQLSWLKFRIFFAAFNGIHKTLTPGLKATNPCTSISSLQTTLHFCTVYPLQWILSTCPTCCNCHTLNTHIVDRHAPKFTRYARPVVKEYSTSTTIAVNGAS